MFDICDEDDEGRRTRAEELLQREIHRHLGYLMESIAANEPKRENLFAQVALHRRRMRRAAEAMNEYFDAYLEWADLQDQRRHDVDEARKCFARDLDKWFRHFLSRVDDHGVYCPDPCLDEWPQNTYAVHCPPIRISLTSEPTPQERTIIGQQGERIEQLQRECDALDHERRTLQRRLAELEPAGPDSYLDDFQRSLDQFAGPDADAAERAEVWVRQRTEQYESLIPQNDPSRLAKVLRFERKLRERADVVLEAWRKQREEAIGGQA